MLAINSVPYRGLSDGYELNVDTGWIGKLTSAYPLQFWKGLGLKKSNVKP